MGVAPSCNFYNAFLVKGTAPAQKKPICAGMKVNTQVDFELCLFTENVEVLATYITNIIVAMYFTSFEGLILYRNTRRPCYVSERAYSCRVREF